MTPSDPWLRGQLAPARRQLLAVVAGGLLSCGLVLGQAWAVAGLVVAVLRGDELTTPALVLAGVLVARGLVAALSDLAAARAAAVVGSSLRRQLVTAVVERDLPGPTGAVSVLATRGVSAAEPYLTRYLPALVLAACCRPSPCSRSPPRTCSAPSRAGDAAPGAGVRRPGRAGHPRPRPRAVARDVLAVRPLPRRHARPPDAGRPPSRPRPVASRIAAVTDRYRIASLRTLRIAFASSLVLELVATLSVALVAVSRACDSPAGSLGLHTALVVLLLAPEAYWPLRRVGAEFHAAAEGAPPSRRSATRWPPGPATPRPARPGPARARRRRWSSGTSP